jgi:hypothetical protein
MIVNIKEIYERLCDSEDWDPIVFENHRGQKLCFEQVATLDYEGEHYAYLYEIDEYGEHVHDFPAVLVLDDENKTLDFVTDSKLGDPEAIDEDDKARRNRGWMKGPASAFVGDGTTPLRDAETAARLILGTFNLTEGDHWVRFKNVMEGDNTVAEFMHNYFEIVPRGIIMDPANPEDKN